MTASLLCCPVCRHDWSWHDIDGCGTDCTCDRPGRWRLIIDWLGRPHLANTERQKHWRALGLVDHGCWPDDTAAWVRSESYAPPVLDRTLTRHGLVVVVNAVDPA